MLRGPVGRRFPAVAACGRRAARAGAAVGRLLAVPACPPTRPQLRGRVFRSGGRPAATGCSTARRSAERRLAPALPRRLRRCRRCRSRTLSASEERGSCLPAAGASADEPRPTCSARPTSADLRAPSRGRRCPQVCSSAPSRACASAASRLPDSDVTQVGGFRCTRRTAARRLDIARSRAASGRRGRRSTSSSVARSWGRVSSAKPARRLSGGRGVARSLGEPSPSPTLEPSRRRSRAARAARPGRDPRRAPARRPRRGGDFVARVDLAFVERRVAIEYDGAWHANAGQFALDRRRLNRLVAAGWTVLHVTRPTWRPDGAHRSGTPALRGSSASGSTAV